MSSPSPPPHDIPQKISMLKKAKRFLYRQILYGLTRDPEFWEWHDRLMAKVAAYEQSHDKKFLPSKKES